MESLHPVDIDMRTALIPVIIAMVLLWITVDFDVWSKLMVKVDWLVHGVMGLWGE